MNSYNTFRHWVEKKEEKIEEEERKKSERRKKRKKKEGNVCTDEVSSKAKLQNDI